MKVTIDIEEIISENIDSYIESELNGNLESFIIGWLEENHNELIETILNSSSIEAIINRKIEERIKIRLRDIFYKIQKL